MSDEGQRRLADSCLCAGNPFNKMGIVSMFIMKVRNIIINNRVDEGVFDVGAGGVNPSFHFFCQLTKLGIDNGAVGGLDVLTPQEEDGFPFCLSDGYLTFLEAMETQLV